MQWHREFLASSAEARESLYCQLGKSKSRSKKMSSTLTGKGRTEGKQVVDRKHRDWQQQWSKHFAADATRPQMMQARKVGQHTLGLGKALSCPFKVTNGKGKEERKRH